MPQPRMLYKDSRLRLASVDQLLLAIWNDAPAMEQMRVPDETIAKHQHSLSGRKQVFVNVVLNGTPSFSDEVRSAASALGQRYSAGRAAVAHIIMVSGLKGITVRAFTSTGILLARPRAPTKVFDNLETAANWLVSYLNGLWTTERFLAAYEDARTG